MTLQEAMRERHTVRKFKNEPLSSEVADKLCERCKRLNQEHGVSIKFMQGDKKAIPGLLKLIMTKGVNNYFILSGPDVAGIDEKIGYCSADLMLYAQTLGLNTWWVGGMYSKANAKKNVDEHMKAIGVLIVGYGETNGIAHKSKEIQDVASYEGDMPDWFKAGVEAALLAPTGMNRQEFTIKGSGNKVSMTVPDEAFAEADLGISKYHFELGAGKDKFTWI